MRLAPLYQEEKEKVRQEGKQEGKQDLILIWLNRKFGQLDSLLIEQIQVLSAEQLNLLGAALLDFSEIAQLETWLLDISQADRNQQA
jgi:predicted transposase YdaD